MGGLILPPTVETIGTTAYQKCSYVKKLVIPRSTKTIGKGAFQDCTGLTEIDFFDTDNLAASVHNPESGRMLENDSDKPALLEIKNQAFDNIPQTTELKLPDSLTIIGDQAFQNNSSLKEVHLGISTEAKLATVGSQVFHGANAIETVHSANLTPPVGQEDSFDDETYKKAYLRVPEQSQQLYENPEPAPWIKFKKELPTGIEVMKQFPWHIAGGMLTLAEESDIYDVAGRQIGHGVKSVKLPSTGIYVVRTGSQTFKIIL